MFLEKGNWIWAGRPRRLCNALDGLYLLMAEEERRIRRNPPARTTDLLKKSTPLNATKNPAQGRVFYAACTIQKFM